MSRPEAASSVVALALAAFVLIASPAAVAVPAAPSDAGPPPSARPGQCFAQFRAPPETRTVFHRVMTVPEQRHVSVVQGACHFELRTDIIRPASSVAVAVAAQTHTVTEHVVVQPAGWRMETIPPVVEMVTEDVVVRPPRREWRSARPQSFGYGPGGPWSQEATPTGEVLCLVEIPAELRRITREVVRTPAQTVAIPTPPVYDSVQRVVVDVPAHEERRDDPGETRQTSVRMCAPPHSIEEVIAPVFADVPTTEVVGPERMEWRETTCAPKPRPRPRPSSRTGPCGCRRSSGESRRAVAVVPNPPVYNAPPTQSRPGVGDRALRRLQEALAAKGYYHGALDGVFTKDTAQAMTRFQHDRHLVEGPYTGETADALGLK